MPTSKAKGRDYSDCKFRTLLTNLPPGVQHMLDRALDSLGLDWNVMPRWKEPVQTPNGAVPENKFFPHASNDICCADGAGFILYQSGVCDLGKDKDLFKSRIAGAIHWAHYYWPHEKNTDICSLEEEIPNTKDPKDIDTKSWLPGDYFLYFDKGKPDTAGHINVYLGPFVEVVDGQDITNPIYEIFNSSIGITGGNEFCTPGSVAGHIRYCKSVGRSIFRCRVKAIERLFRGVISAPIQLVDETPKPKDPPRAEKAWALATAAQAPYPVGRNLTWHDGIHFVFGDGVKSQAVECFAPGELVLARFGKDRSADHTSMLLLRHRFLSSQARLLPPIPADPATDDPDASSAQWLYSLYAQLAPITAYTVDGTQISPGIPELYGQRGDVGELPAGKMAAPPWLLRIWPRPKPELIKVVPDTAALKLVALSRTQAGGKPQLAVLGQPDQLTTRHYYPLSDLESVTVDGTKYWVVPPPGEQTNADAWDGKIPPPTVPRNKKLSYYNPHTRNTLDTPLRLPPQTILQHEDKDGMATLVRVTGEDGAPIKGDKGTLISIADHDQPGLSMSSLVHSDDPRKDQYDFDDQAQVISFTDNAKKILVYADTQGTGDKRYFADESAFDLAALKSDREFHIKERADTGPRTKTPRAWVDLVPGIWMSDDEISKVEALLAKQETAVLEEISARLKKTHSALVGVKVKAGEWVMQDNDIIVSSDPAPTDPLTIYCKIEGSGLARSFTPPPTGGAVDQEHTFSLSIDPPSGVRIYPVLKPQGRVQTAVFEALFATTEEGTNQAQIDEVEQENKAKEPLAKKLLAGELVDLRSEGQLTQQDRNVPREVIAHMGDVAAPVDQPDDNTVPGLHFELFSGKNLVDASVTGNDGALVPIGKSPWVVWKDSSSDGFFSKTFVNKLIDLFRKGTDTHWLDLTDLDAAFGQDNVVQPEEWIAFCQNPKNQRTLSRLITVHPPEWTIDWSRQVKTADTRGIHSSDQDKDQLSKRNDKLQWGQGITLEGIDQDVFLYHPLRFIEWVNTGVDFAISGLAKGKQAKVKVKPLEEGDETDLPPDAKDPSLFRFRTFAGEGSKDQLPIRVTLENVDTATPKFTALVKRGEVHTIRLMQPRVRWEFQDAENSLASEYAIPVSLGDVSGRGGWLLADGNAALTDTGYSRVTIQFTVEYNVRIPGNITLQLSGDSAFRMSHLEFTGVQVAPPANPGTSVSMSIKDDAQIAPAVEDSVVRSARAYTMSVDVIASTRKVDTSAILSATFSGGDLISPITEKVTIATRKLTFSGANPPRGEDVAKLQLYLSQLIAADDLPCYRDAGRGEYTGPDFKASHVDGAYGTSLARALWRFIYTYGTQKDFAAWPIAVKDAKGGDAGSATQDQITAVPHALLEGKPPAKQVDPANGPADLYAQRLGGYGKYNSYPVVDAPLILEITKRFKPPFLLPHLEIFFEIVVPPSPPPDSMIGDGLNKDGNIGKSTILPMPGDSLSIRIEWQGAHPTDGDLPIGLELPDASAYRLDFGTPVPTMTTTLSNLLSNKELKLLSSGKISTNPKDNLLTIRSLIDSRVLGQRQLHGSRDLFKAQSGESCRDAAWVQSWLARIPDQSGDLVNPSIYKNTRADPKDRKKQLMLIDGVWNAKCVEALNRFSEQYLHASQELPTLLSSIKAEAARHP